MDPGVEVRNGPTPARAYSGGIWVTCEVTVLFTLSTVAGVTVNAPELSTETICSFDSSKLGSSGSMSVVYWNTTSPAKLPSLGTGGSKDHVWSVIRSSVVAFAAARLKRALSCSATANDPSGQGSFSNTWA